VATLGASERLRLLRAIVTPETPHASFLSVDVVAFGRKLSVGVIVPPEPVLGSVDVVALGTHGAVLVIRHEQAMTNPAGAIRCHAPRIAEPDSTGFVSDLCKVQVCVHGAFKYDFSEAVYRCRRLRCPKAACREGLLMAHKRPGAREPGRAKRIKCPPMIARPSRP
jgi:hypothetical protein